MALRLVRTVAATMPHAKPPEKTDKHFLGKLGPLCNAAYFGETDEVKALLDKGTDPDERGGDLNFTPLMLASMTKSGNFPIAEMLLQAGASVEAKDNSFNNALAIACSGGDERIVKMLIEGGSDVNNLNRGKWGPLTLAVKHLNGAAAKLVLEAGADAEPAHAGHLRAVGPPRPRHPQRPPDADGRLGVVPRRHRHPQAAQGEDDGPDRARVEGSGGRAPRKGGGGEGGGGGDGRADAGGGGGGVKGRCVEYTIYYARAFLSRVFITASWKCGPPCRWKCPIRRGATLARSRPRARPSPTAMVFHLIGIGLADEEDITLKGLRAVKKSAVVYIEAYTSILAVPREARGAL